MERNNFGLIRFFAASAVIISHTFSLTGREYLEPLRLINFHTSLGELAVYVFFILSGFLLANSITKKPYFKYFISRRILRIFPALFLYYILSTYIIGPIISNLDTHSYFSNPLILAYFKNFFLFISPFHFSLPGVFEVAPMSPIVNGSLWTIPYEFLAYIALALTIPFKLWKKQVILFYILLATFVFRYALHTDLLPLDSTFIFMQLKYILIFLPYFIMGILLFNNSGMIKKYSFDKILLVFLAGHIFYTTLIYEFFLAIMLPMIVVKIAFYELPASYYKLNILGNYSYGMYIWGWFITQLFILIFSRNSSLLTVLIPSLTISIVAGFLSWNFIEKHFISY